MTTKCFWCIIKPFDSCIYISKFLNVNCTHLQDKVQLEYFLSPKHILMQIIFYLPFITTSVISTNQLSNNPSMEQSKYWFEFTFAIIPNICILVCNSFLITNKERFDFYYLSTDILIFAEQTNLQLLKQSDLILLNNYMKFMKILLFINPVSVLCLYIALTTRDYVYIDIGVFFAIYMVFCLGFYAIILTKFHIMVYYNLKSEIKNLFLLRNGNNIITDEFVIKFKIIQNVLKKIYCLDKKSELILRPIITIVIILIPLLVEIILVYVQNKILIGNLQKYAYYTRELVLLLCIFIFSTLFLVVLIQIELMQRPVSYFFL